MTRKFYREDTFDDRRYQDYDERRGEDAFRETKWDRLNQKDPAKWQEDGDWDDMDHD